jgi:hypothetical protein
MPDVVPAEPLELAFVLSVALELPEFVPKPLPPAAPLPAATAAPLSEAIRTRAVAVVLIVFMFHPSGWNRGFKERTVLEANGRSSIWFRPTEG